MGGKGSGRKPEYTDLYHMVQRQKMREIYRRRQIALADHTEKTTAKNESRPSPIKEKCMHGETKETTLDFDGKEP